MGVSREATGRESRSALPPSLIHQHREPCGKSEMINWGKINVKWLSVSKMKEFHDILFLIMEFM